MDDPNRPAPPTATVDDLFALATYDFPLVLHAGTAHARTVVLKLRRIDAMTRLVEDIVPMPLMMAATQVIGKVAEHMGGEQSEVAVGQAFASLTEDERAELREMLWRNAIAVTVAPPLSLGETPGTFPVTLLSIETLLRIYMQNPPHVLAPMPGGAAGEDFRPAVGTEAAVAGSTGAAVRAEAEQLVPAAVAS